MQVKFLGDFQQDIIREHPWTTSERDPKAQYYDFRAHPELIEQVLEDFKGAENYEAIKIFYDMLRWINGDESLLESNDSALDPPHPNTIVAVNKPITCGGRLMIFFRDLKLNTIAGNPEWLLDGMGYCLDKAPGNQLTFAQLTFFDTFFRDLPGTREQKFGKEIVCEFWAWGDTEEETMENFKIIVKNLFDAVKTISEKLKMQAEQDKEM